MDKTQLYYIDKAESHKIQLYRYLLSIDIDNLSADDVELFYILSKDKKIQKILDNE